MTPQATYYYSQIQLALAFYQICIDQLADEDAAPYNQAQKFLDLKVLNDARKALGLLSAKETK